MVYNMERTHGLVFLNKCSCTTPPEDGFKEAETYVGVF
jgi:hypothetical protein